MEPQTAIAECEDLSRQIISLSKLVSSHEQRAELTNRLESASKRVIPREFRGAPLSQIVQRGGLVHHVIYEDKEKSITKYRIQRNRWFRQMEVYECFVSFTEGFEDPLRIMPPCQAFIHVVLILFWTKHVLTKCQRKPVSRWHRGLASNLSLSQCRACSFFESRILA